MPVSRREALALSAAALGAAAVSAQETDDLSTIGKTPHTKFAVNVEMWFRKLPFLDRIKKAADLGFPAVEFWPWENKDLGEIAKISNERGIAIAQFTAWGFEPGLNDPKNHANFVKAIEKGCKAAKTIGADKMCVVGGNDQRGMSQVQMHENIIAGLKLAAPIAEENKIMLILEPMNIRVDHKGHCLYGSPPAVKICREVNSPMVKINWDLYHMHITEGDLCRRLKEGFDQVGYLQVADNPGRHEPGTGEINYSRVFREALTLGYKGFVGLECTPEGDDIVAAKRVAASDQW